MGKNQLQRSQKNSLDITRPYNLVIDIFQNFASELKAITQQLIYIYILLAKEPFQIFQETRDPPGQARRA